MKVENLGFVESIFYDKQMTGGISVTASGLALSLAGGGSSVTTSRINVVASTVFITYGRVR